MSTYQKISRWVSEIERDLENRARLKSLTESRIAHKVDFITTVISQNERNPMAKMDHIKRITRIASMVQPDSNMQVLAQVEREIDEIYGDLGKVAGSDLQEMVELTTYSEGDPQFRDITPKFDFSEVQRSVSNPVPVKKSSWADFAEDAD